jgi:hypothetical protein
MKVRANSVYYYHPNLLDRCDARTDLKSGDTVRVVNLQGCPRANTMGHCHVADPSTGQFIGLVHCNSLHTKAEYIAYLHRAIAKLAPVQETITAPITEVWPTGQGRS